MRYEFPGFIDVHVHFRDPGVPEAETTETGLCSAGRGGFSAVVTMPNTTPAIDSPEHIRNQLQKAASASFRRTILYPSGCLTKGRLGREVADLEAMADAGAVFFTDDGSYVFDDHVMEEAMNRAAALGMAVCDHAMLPTKGVIRDCALARRLGLPIIPVSVETGAIRRDLSLCRETGCRLHIQHISTAEGVDLIRQAQAEGLPVTAEATPHHLLLSCDDLTDDDANFKMAPPLGNHEDRAELRRAVKDGLLFFATDHAPHPVAKKSIGFGLSANGIIGLEAAVPLTYEVMVEEEGMSIDDWAKAWSEMPRALISSPAVHLSPLKPTVLEVGEERTIDVDSFASKSRNCPYHGLKGRCWPCK